MAEIIIEGDGQFPMDVRVPIVGTRFSSDRSLTIRAEGTHRGRSVGLEITVKCGMKPGLRGDEIDKTAFYRNGIIVRGLGNNTRHLADLLSDVYITPIGTPEPLNQLDFTSFALDGDPMLIESEHVNFKLFHDDSDTSGLYFEMFLHIDLPEGYVRLDEKDEEYRPTVVNSFAALPA